MNKCWGVSSRGPLQWKGSLSDPVECVPCVVCIAIQRYGTTSATTDAKREAGLLRVSCACRAFLSAGSACVWSPRTTTFERVAGRGRVPLPRVVG